MKQKNRFIRKESTRLDHQRKIYDQIEEEKHCPFCKENFLKYHKLPIIKEGEFWILTDNQWPYEKVKHQLMAVYKTHVEHITEMDPSSAPELFEMFQEECKKRNIPGGGVAIRFGSNPEHGGYGNSVLHLHAHLIEPDLDKLGSNEAWRFKFGQPKNYVSLKKKIIDKTPPKG